MQVKSNGKLCPITFGLPTKMTKKGFKKSCLEKQQDVIRTYKGTTDERKRIFICSTCKGKNKPAELEIIKLEEMVVGIRGNIKKMQPMRRKREISSNRPYFGDVFILP